MQITPVTNNRPYFTSFQGYYKIVGPHEQLSALACYLASSADTVPRASFPWVIRDYIEVFTGKHLEKLSALRDEKFAEGMKSIGDFVFGVGDDVTFSHLVSKKFPAKSPALLSHKVIKAILEGCFNHETGEITGRAPEKPMLPYNYLQTFIKSQERHRRSPESLAADNKILEELGV